MISFRTLSAFLSLILCVQYLPCCSKAMRHFFNPIHSSMPYVQHLFSAGISSHCLTSFTFWLLVAQSGLVLSYIKINFVDFEYLTIHLSYVYYKQMLFLWYLQILPSWVKKCQMIKIS